MSTIDQIVAELQESIAKAEASTAGKWKYERGEGIVAFTKDADKQFIANAHNNGPRHARMLLAVIEKASEVYNRPSRRSPDYARAIGHILRAIQEAAE